MRLPDSPSDPTTPRYEIFDFLNILNAKIKKREILKFIIKLDSKISFDFYLFDKN